MDSGISLTHLSQLPHWHAAILLSNTHLSPHSSNTTQTATKKYGRARSLRSVQSRRACRSDRRAFTLASATELIPWRFHSLCAFTASPLASLETTRASMGCDST